MTRATKSKAGTPPGPTIPAVPPADVLGRITVPGNMINYGPRSGGWPDTERRHVITNRD